MFGFFKKKKKNGEEAKPTPQQQKQQSVGDNYETYEEYEAYDPDADSQDEVKPVVAAQPIASNARSGFTLTIGAIDKEIKDPTDADIKRAVDSLFSDPDAYLILQCDDTVHPIFNNVEYMQATGGDTATGKVHVEVSVLKNGDNHNYANDVSRSELYEMLVNFTEDIIPDITDWECMF